MHKGQILLGCCDYWEDCYKEDAMFSAGQYGIEVRRKKGTKNVWQGHVTHIPYFYVVTDVVGEYATLIKCKENEDYMGAETIYYDTPCCCTPLCVNGEPVTIGDSFKRKIRKDYDGEYVMIESYIRASLWYGTPEDKYNLH